MNNIIKTIATTLLASVIMAPATAQENKVHIPDTLLDVSADCKVTLLENHDGLKILVQDNDSTGSIIEDINMKFPPRSTVTSRQSTRNASAKGVSLTSIRETMQHKRSRYSFVMSGVCLGLINPIEGVNTDGLEWSKSIEICWMQCAGIGYQINRSLNLSLGLGFDWRNYKITTSDKRLVVNADHKLEWGLYPEGSKPKNSRLKIFSLQVPLLLNAAIPHTSLVVNAGPILNFNTYGSVLTSYDDLEGNEYRDFTKDIDKRLFTVDLMCNISYRNSFGLYVRYSPMKVINGNSPINFQPLSVGVSLGLGNILFIKSK